MAQILIREEFPDVALLMPRYLGSRAFVGTGRVSAECGHPQGHEEHGVVYVCFAGYQDPRPMYVGYTKHIEKRWACHRRTTWWWPMVTHGWFDCYQGRRAALAAESLTIGRLDPRCDLALPAAEERELARRLKWGFEG